MKYNINWLLEQRKQESKIKYLHFWGHGPEKNGQVNHACLSQWWHAPFKIGDVFYPTAEHWMMAEKARLFGNNALRNKIITCESPGEAKALGRMVVNFDEDTWLKNRYDIVLEGSFQKFTQNPQLRTFLLNTSGRILVEASPVDHIWGIGLAASDPRAADPENGTG
ncbi:NADAR family protein [Dyadobacter sp. CY261]|uniref:NADAR family protein n=1 Tax=Dyadobacter sp. CY261 TaxID=2907203 RepID=UPI001F4358FA|nr:NADAR family protein [Dyadobacter sp. CY261]MCF0073756.1 NADAR family protein [Dyadobacter sp. CY261]